jgi:dUTP pyrophosphatase
VESFIIERMNDDAVIPTKAYPTDAGFDLYLSEELVIWSQETAIGKTGIRIELKPGYEAQIRPRSGFSSRYKIMIINSPGTLDFSYTGEILISMFNLGSTRQVIKKGTRVAQMIINKLPEVSLVEGKINTNTDRGENGFGSTGE